MFDVLCMSAAARGVPLQGHLAQLAHDHLEHFQPKATI